MRCFEEHAHNFSQNESSVFLQFRDYLVHAQTLDNIRGLGPVTEHPLLAFSFNKTYYSSSISYHLLYFFDFLLKFSNITALPHQFADLRFSGVSTVDHE